MGEGILIDTGGVECCCLPPPVFTDCPEFNTDRAGFCGHLPSIGGGTWTGLVIAPAGGLGTQIDMSYSNPQLFHPEPNIFVWRQKQTPPECLNVGQVTATNLETGNSITRLICSCDLSICQDAHGSDFTAGESHILCSPVPAGGWAWEYHAHFLGVTAVQGSFLPGCATQAGPWIPYLWGGVGILNNGSFSL